MKETVIFIGGFDAQYQNYYLDTFLVPGLLSQLKGIDIKLAPEDVKIPGQTGKRFFCQLEKKKKTIDIYEVYWDDLVDRLSTKNIRQQFSRGLGMIFFWLSHCWKIMNISPIFFFQTSTALLLMLLWYFGIVVLVLSALGNQQDTTSVPAFLEDLLEPVISWADGAGLQIWLTISTLLALSPHSINRVTDFTDFIANYFRDESTRGRPPVRALLRNRIKQAVDNVNSEGAYDQITILAHSMGGLIATDFLADYRSQKGCPVLFITLGSPLEISCSMTRWVKLEIKKCLENPHIERWDDFHSSQDWLCSKVPVPNGQYQGKLVSQRVSFKVSLLKQMSGDSHLEYFFDPKVLRHLVLGGSAQRLAAVARQRQ